MKKFTVEILRKNSFKDNWHLSRVIEIEARTLKSALNKANKFVTPYQIYGKVEEIKTEVKA